MKTLLPVLIVFCFIAFAPTPSVKAQDYIGPVYKSRIPVNEKSGGVDIEHRSVRWWGGWVSNIEFRYYDRYSKSSPRTTFITTTTPIITNNKVNRRR